MKLHEFIRQLERLANVDPHIEVELVTRLQSGATRTARITDVRVRNSILTQKLAVQIADFKE